MKNVYRAIAILFSAMKLRRRLSSSSKTLRIWRKVRALVEEFLETTSMHGLKYIGGNYRPTIER